MSESTKKIKIENVSLQMEISDAESNIENQIKSQEIELHVNEKNISSYLGFLNCLISLNAVFLGAIFLNKGIERCIIGYKWQDMSQILSFFCYFIYYFLGNLLFTIY